MTSIDIKVNAAATGAVGAATCSGSSKVEVIHNYIDGKFVNAKSGNCHTFASSPSALYHA
jgi:hypothetical protein